MNDLITMAFQCDAHALITYMLEDERSEFTYDHVMRRTFTQDTRLDQRHLPRLSQRGPHGDQNDFASITWWNVGVVAKLATKLDAIMEENGKTARQHADHVRRRDARQRPCLQSLAARAHRQRRGTFTTDQHVSFNTRWLRDCTTRS